MNVYDINDGLIYSERYSIVAEDMGTAEAMFKKKYPYSNIKGISVHAEDVEVQPQDDKTAVKKDIHS